ncbi:GNAT family N-acetyltransferase [uncultured Psychrobacter sp.]|uniref:GNAT family N-acetyltransferase n=1 Tax=uncultured Psychrobacter sp. TaxID=259303 RepID=UPI003459887B
MFFVRKASSHDYLDIANIHFTSWHAAYADVLPESYVQQKNDLSEKIIMWQKLLSHPSVLVWIAYDDNHNNLGFIGYFATADNYEITTLYVLPEYHSLGIGTALIDVSLQYLLNTNANAHFYLWVLKTNLNAINFYEKLGFVANGENSEELYESTRIIDIKMMKN